MFRCIVAPVDGSTFGEHAVPLAASLASAAGVTLHLVHVHEPLVMASGVEVVAFSGPWTEVTKEHERAYLKGLAERVSGAFEVRVEPVLIDGAVALALERYTRDCGAGLVVMSTHAHTRFQRLWHHGVADQIARDLPIPVLLVRPDDEEAPELATPRPIRNILIPLDGSLASEEAIRSALKLGQPAGARYTLLRVVPVGSKRAAGQSERDQGRSSTGEYLEMHARQMRARGHEVRTQVLEGEPAGEAILQYLRDSEPDPRRRVDAVAMSCRTRSSVSRIVGTHTSDLVLRGANVPVLLSHPCAPAAAPADAPAPVVRA